MGDVATAEQAWRTRNGIPQMRTHVRRWTREVSPVRAITVAEARGLWVVGGEDIGPGPEWFREMAAEDGAPPRARSVARACARACG